MHKRISFWLALVGIAFAVRLVVQLRQPPPAAPPLAEPARSPFPDSIGGRGIVESVDENVRIAPAVAGLVTRIFVKVGDEMKEGDPLFEQDQREALLVGLAFANGDRARLREVTRELDLQLVRTWRDDDGLTHGRGR